MVPPRVTTVRRRQGVAEERSVTGWNPIFVPLWNRYLQEALVTIRNGRYVLP